MAAQKPTDPFRSMTYEIRAGLRRFRGLSWWWKGPILGVIAAVILVPVLVVALAGGNGDDSAVLELTQEPTPTAATATPTPIPTRIPTPLPPTTTPTPEPPTPTPTPEPSAQEEPPPPTAAPAIPQRTLLPPGLVTGIAMTFQVQVTHPGLVIPSSIFGDVGFETQCEYDDGGRIIRAITTISVSPRAYWENWEGAPLTYTWSASNGSISGNGLTATYTQLGESAYIEQGEVTLTVSDGSGASAAPGFGVSQLRQCE